MLGYKNLPFLVNRIVELLFRGMYMQVVYVYNPKKSNP